MGNFKFHSQSLHKDSVFFFIYGKIIKGMFNSIQRSFENLSNILQKVVQDFRKSIVVIYF